MFYGLGWLTPTLVVLIESVFRGRADEANSMISDSEMKTLSHWFLISCLKLNSETVPIALKDGNIVNGTITGAISVVRVAAKFLWESYL